MPHLQEDTAQKKHRKETIVGSVIGIDSSSSRIEELPIQVATPNFLGASDPVVAMARKVSATVVDSSFESVESNGVESLLSPSSSGVIKTVITPSSSIGNISNSSASSDDVSAVETASTSTQKINAGPFLTTVCSESRLSHSPILVKRRVSQTEGEESSDAQRQQQTLNHEIRESAYFKYGESLSNRPAKIRRGSSLILDSQIVKEDPCEEKVSKTKSKSYCAAGDGAIISTTSSGKISTAEAVAAATTKIDVRKKKPVISPTTSTKQGEDSSAQLRQSPQLCQQPPHILHHGFHPSAVAAPGFHPHPASFGGHPYGSPGGYHMAYPTYSPHVSPGVLHPFMGSQFHGHPGAGFYSPYPPSFHPHQIHQHSGEHLPSFVHPCGHPANGALSAAKISSNATGMNTENRNDKNNPGSVMQSVYMRDNSALHPSMSSTQTSKPGGDGKPLSANRCVPLQEPIPSKHWGKADGTEGTTLPDFHRLVNFPDYLTKSRSLGSGDAGASGGSKAVGGKKHCVMCGKLRICSASSLMEKGRAAAASDDGTSHIIPRQNKGLCTACDVTVWVLVSEGVEIKWCKGCKNFRQWAAFGDKGSATKCVRCRERQREKYAMQKNAKRARGSDKNGNTDKCLPLKLSSSSQHSSSSSQRIGSVEEKEGKHFAAARGLTNLMNAAAAL